MKKIYIIKFKKIFMPSLFMIFTICLILFSKSNLAAAKTGVLLFANSIVPSLFPFFVATELLSHTNIVHILGKIFSPLMKPLFHIRGEGSFPFIMGFLSGYPMGAKIAVQFRNEKICSKEECERLLSFTNNSGPLFIIGTVGISLLGNYNLGVLLFFSHVIASITVGIIFRYWKYNNKTTSILKSKKDISFSIKKSDLKINNLGEVIGTSIMNSISTIMLIGGFVVLFSVIISILQSSKILYYIAFVIKNIFSYYNLPINLISSFITGLFEITNGINSLSAFSTSYFYTTIALISFVLGFGGISVLLQIWSVISKSDLSIKPYFYGKLLQGFLSSIYTLLFLVYFL